MKIHHIGYLVKSIEKAEKCFLKLGYKVVQKKTYDKYREINIVFLSKDGHLIELVAPVSADSVVTGLYKRMKNSPYHICYETDDFNDELTLLTENGFVQIGEPCVAPAIQNRRVCFLMSSSIGLIEILEKE